jgi:hypothetical protein
MWAQNRRTALWHPAEGLRGQACERWTGCGQDLELALVHNDIDSHRARIPGCTATCVWCASVLFDVPSAKSRKTCTDVTMACAQPVRDPEMLALDHIPPLGPARGPFPRFRCAGGVPRGVDLNPPLIRSTPLAPHQRPMQPAPGLTVWLTCPAEPAEERSGRRSPRAAAAALRGRTFSWRRASIGGQGV